MICWIRKTTIVVVPSIVSHLRSWLSQIEEGPLATYTQIYLSEVCVLVLLLCLRIPLNPSLNLFEFGHQSRFSISPSKHGFRRDRATERAPGVVRRCPVESGRWSEPGGSDRLQGRLPGDDGLLPGDLPLRRAFSSHAATHGRSSPLKLRQLHRN